MKIIKTSLLLALGLFATSVAAKNTGSIVLSDAYDDCILLESLFDCTDCDDEAAHGSYMPYDTNPTDGTNIWH
jgi:hypothetical protein